MSRAAKWLVTGVASAVAFGFSLWLAAAVRLPFLPRADGDRWGVNTAFALVIATFVVACGAWWAGRENRPESTDSNADGAGQQITQSPGSFQLGPGARMKTRRVNVTVNAPPVRASGGDEAGLPKA